MSPSPATRPRPKRLAIVPSRAIRVRDFAYAVVTSPDLAVKLSPPARAVSEMVDDVSADERRRLDPAPSWPARSEALEIVPIRKAQVPSLEGWRDPHQRRRIVHALANHELQAAELFAWALLRFADAPAALRRGLLGVLLDEQRHTRMYVARLGELGAVLGDYPVSGYFWHKAASLTTPARFLCAMSLTFENANLDHTIESAAAARAGGDEKTAAVIDRVHLDERRHVRLGWEWLARLKRPEQSMWEAYVENLTEPLHPGRASGRFFDTASRRAVGMDERFIAELERLHGFTERGGQRRIDPVTGKALGTGGGV